jgi:dTDP-4-dehydrorhamnose 3,5-epimerase
MTFTETKLQGVYIVDCDVFHDDRGLFERAWVREEFEARRLDTRIAQCNIVVNARRGTIRGLHFQVPPFGEAKTVRALRGAVFDVAVDLRHESPTAGQWVGVDLSAANRRLLYVPAGLAHGYQTLTDDTELVYFVSATYSPEHQRGVRWDDPAFGISWPDPPTTINERDRTFPDFVWP